MASIYGNKLCTSTKNVDENNDEDVRLEYFGIDSKCFTSTAVDPRYRAGDSNRCHKFKCADDWSSIRIFIP